LPAEVYDYYAGGAGDEWTLRESRAAWERWSLRPRVLAGVGEPDPSTVVLGDRLAFPVLVAPWAYQRMAHPDGELATARAAGEAGTIMVVSTTAFDIAADVATAGDGSVWWQLYVFEDRGHTEETLHRVVDAGYRAVCLTVDFPQAGLRYRDARSGFVMPIGLPGSDLVYEPELSWEDLPWIRERIGGLPLVLKGILTGEDARLAVEAGVDGIVVSNHGGRQLDGSPAGITVLPEIVVAGGGRVPVLVDGGVRRGVDVVRALALGAAAVLVGRPCAWGLAAAGGDGVRDVLGILRQELVNAMALCGARSVPEIGRGLVMPAP
jgi:4-hydroxymandelate oxidase